MAEHDIESLLEENKKLKKENKKFKDLYVKKSKEARSMEKQLEIEKDVILGLEEEIERVKGLLNEGTMMKEIERLEKELKGAEEVVEILDAEADEARYEAKEYKEEIEELRKKLDRGSEEHLADTQKLNKFYTEKSNEYKEEIKELKEENETLKKLEEQLPICLRGIEANEKLKEENKKLNDVLSGAVLEIVSEDNQKLEKEIKHSEESWKKLAEKYEGEGEWRWAEVESWIDGKDEEIEELKEKADKIENIIREFGTNGIVDRCLPIWYDEDE